LAAGLAGCLAAVSGLEPGVEVVLGGVELSALATSMVSAGGVGALSATAVPSVPAPGDSFRSPPQAANTTSAARRIQRIAGPWASMTSSEAALMILAFLS
jgi:hypothetical protein